MRFMIPKFVLAAVVLTMTALSTHTANAQTPLKVPFDFTVAGQTMPAGLYTVHQDTFRNTIILTSKDTSRSFSWILVPGDPVANEVHIALTFDTAGNAHALRSIQYGSRTTARLDKAPRTSGYDIGRLSQGR